MGGAIDYRPRGLSASLGAFVVVSLITSRPSPDELDTWKRRIREPAGSGESEDISVGDQT